MNGQVTKIKHLTILDPFNVYETGSQWMLEQLNTLRISLTVITINDNNAVQLHGKLELYAVIIITVYKIININTSLTSICRQWSFLKYPTGPQLV